jgi:hypothetical protein
MTQVLIRAIGILVGSSVVVETVGDRRLVGLELEVEVFEAVPLQ